MRLLEGKTAIVTGSARGIGRMIALELARSGASLAICDLDKERCQPVIDEIRNLGQPVIAFACDVTKEAQVTSMARTTMDQFGSIDILINNAGWQFVATLEQSTVEDWDRTMSINLRGPFLCSKAVIPVMRQQGSGVIINVTSRAGRVPKAKAAAYGASKFGLNGLTLCLTLEVADFGIRVLALAPPHTKTPLAKEIMQQLDSTADISNWPDGSEFAKTVAWMASAEASQLNGLIIETGGLRP